MRQGKKEFIRINLNRKKGFLKKIKSFNSSSLKEFSAGNLYLVLFVIGILSLILSALVSFYMKNKIEDLENQVAQAKEKKDKLLAEIRALRNKIADLEFEQKLADYLRKHNESVTQEILEVQRMQGNLVVQNLSLCSGIGSKECDIEEASRIILGSPIVQMDVVAFGNTLDLNRYQLMSQTYVEVGGLPIKRFCLQKLNEPVETVKK